MDYAFRQDKEQMNVSFWTALLKGSPVILVTWLVALFGEWILQFLNWDTAKAAAAFVTTALTGFGTLGYLRRKQRKELEKLEQERKQDEEKHALEMAQARANIAAFLVEKGIYQEGSGKSLTQMVNEYLEFEKNQKK